MSVPIRASAPSPDDLERAALREKKDAASRAAAEPWRAALMSAVPADWPDRGALADVLFRITYKHYDPCRHKGPILRAWAEEISEAPFRMPEERRNVGVVVSWEEQLEAVYELTNSDWKPPLSPVGRGIDRVATGEDLYRWMEALTHSGREAIRAGRDPKLLWHDMALSGGVQKPEDVKRIGLNPSPPPRF
jgi:hypothetical protein